MKDSLRRRFAGWPTEAVSGALLVIGLMLIILALTPGHGLFKIGVLAWVVLP